MSGHTLLGKHWGAGAGPGWLTQLSASSIAAGELKALWNKQLVALLLHRLKETQPWCQAVLWVLLSLVWALMEGEVLFEVPGVFQGLLPPIGGSIPVSWSILVPCLGSVVAF